MFRLAPILKPGVSEKLRIIPDTSLNKLPPGEPRRLEVGLAENDEHTMKKRKNFNPKFFRHLIFITVWGNTRNGDYSVGSGVRLTLIK